MTSSSVGVTKLALLLFALAVLCAALWITYELHVIVAEWEAEQKLVEKLKASKIEFEIRDASDPILRHARFPLEEFPRRVRLVPSQYFQRVARLSIDRSNIGFAKLNELGLEKLKYIVKITLVNVPTEQGQRPTRSGELRFTENYRYLQEIKMNQEK